MRKVLRTFAAGLLLTVSLLTGSAQAITDYGDTAFTRLWYDDNFVCSASYIFPYINDSMSWIVTAGHCTIGDEVKRDADTTVVAKVNWRGMVLWDKRYTSGCADVAVGTVPDARTNHRHLWLSDKMPERGIAYVHGFPIGVENVTYAQILNEKQVVKVLGKEGAEFFQGCRLMATPKGVIKGGSSGSAVLGPDGRVIGILWGLIEAEEVDAPFDLAIVTPIERVLKLMEDIQVRDLPK